MNKYLKFKSILTKNLTTYNIEKILSLKKQVYNYSLRSQKKWFTKNIDLSDTNNLLLYKRGIIGYTALRVKKGFLNKKKIKIFVFDTFLVDKKFRKKGFGSKLMIFNNNIISKKKLNAVLICNKRMRKFYKRFGWENLSKNKIKFINHKIKKKHVMFKNIKKTNINYLTVNL